VDLFGHNFDGRQTKRFESGLGICAIAGRLLARADHDPPLSIARMAGYAFGFNPP
jgi:hypothetical protein